MLCENPTWRDEAPEPNAVSSVLALIAVRDVAELLTPHLPRMGRKKIRRLAAQLVIAAQRPFVEQLTGRFE